MGDDAAAGGSAGDGGAPSPASPEEREDVLGAGLSAYEDEDVFDEAQEALDEELGRGEEAQGDLFEDATSPTTTEEDAQETQRPWRLALSFPYSPRAGAALCGRKALRPDRPAGASFVEGLAHWLWEEGRRGRNDVSLERASSAVLSRPAFWMAFFAVQLLRGILVGAGSFAMHALLVRRHQAAAA